MTIISTGSQFTKSIKQLGTKTNVVRDLVQELLITAVYFAERDGDVAPITRVIDAVKATGSLDNYKVMLWLKTYEAPIKPSADGLTFEFDKAKRHLEQGATRDDFAPYETVMRMEAKWYELAKKDATPKSVWDAENSFESFIKKLEKEGYKGELVSFMNKQFAKAKKDGLVARIETELDEALV